MKDFLQRVIVGCLVVTITSCDQKAATEGKLHLILQKGDQSSLTNYVAAEGGPNRMIDARRGQRISAPILSYAVLYGQTNLVRYLLDVGADPNLRDSRGEPPLFWAVIAAYPGVNDETRLNLLEMLLAANADIEIKSLSEHGETVLIRAAISGKTEMVKALLLAGANPRTAGRTAVTPLHVAGNPDIVRLLINAGADPLARTEAGDTPLDWAKKNGKKEVVTALSGPSEGK